MGKSKIKVTFENNENGLDAVSEETYVITSELVDAWITFNLPMKSTKAMAIRELTKIINNFPFGVRRKETLKEFINRYILKEINLRIENLVYDSIKKGFLKITMEDFVATIKEYINKHHKDSFVTVIYNPLGVFGVTQEKKNVFLFDFGDIQDKDTMIVISQGHYNLHVNYNNKYLSAAVIRQMAKDIREIKKIVGNNYIK